MFARAASVGAESVNPYFINVNKDLVDEAHDLGLAVFVYTVDEEDRMRSLFDIGVDGIFSNIPDRLRAVVDSL
jgi:glycerophosphoryl diester phosphodiesterase